VREIDRRRPLCYTRGSFTELEFHVKPALAPPARDDGLNSSRVLGKVCEKHPELGGVRYQVSHLCIGCQREHRKKSRSTPEAKARKLAKLKAKRDAHAMTEEWKRAIRLRAEKLCLEAGNSPRAAEYLSGRYWNMARQQLNEEHRARNKTDVSMSDLLDADDDFPGMQR